MRDLVQDILDKGEIAPQHLVTITISVPPGVRVVVRQEEST
jgi:hypothetical protein